MRRHEVQLEQLRRQQRWWILCSNVVLLYAVDQGDGSNNQA